MYETFLWGWSFLTGNTNCNNGEKKKLNKEKTQQKKHNYNHYILVWCTNIN